MNTRYCGCEFIVFPVTIMFHTSFIKCFTNLATISWVVMFHVKHYVVGFSYILIECFT